MHFLRKHYKALRTDGPTDRRTETCEDASKKLNVVLVVAVVVIVVVVVVVVVVTIVSVSDSFLHSMFPPTNQDSAGERVWRRTVSQSLLMVWK